MAQETRAELMNELMQANGFDETALATNRMGRLAPSQRKHLVPQLLLALLFSLGPSIAIVYALLFEQISDPPVIIVLVVMALVAALGYGMLRRVLADLFGNRVLMVEGIGRRRVGQRKDSEGRRQTVYYYGIGEKLFKVRVKAFNALENDVMYRAYYTAKTEKLVNIEPV